MDSKTLSDVRFLIALARQHQEAGEGTMSVGVDFLLAFLEEIRACVEIEVALDAPLEDE